MGNNSTFQVYCQNKEIFLGSDYDTLKDIVILLSKNEKNIFYSIRDVENLGRGHCNFSVCRKDEIDEGQVVGEIVNTTEFTGKK